MTLAAAASRLAVLAVAATVSFAACAVGAGTPPPGASVGAGSARSAAPATQPGSASPSASAASSVPSASVASPPASTPPSSSSASVSPSTAATDRPDLAAARIALEEVATGLDAPLFATNAGDGSDRLFVLEQVGRIRIVRDGALLPAPFLDISDRVRAGGEQGLLGLAFPPGFGRGRDTFYVHYSDGNGDTTLSEFRVGSAGADAADRGSERVLLKVDQPFANHNGGWIGFDQSSMLLLNLGDGGSGGDPGNRATRLDTLLGKVLRLDVLGAPAGQPYAIPADNPFRGRSDARPEILHFGLRNPWRASIDRATGALWIGDVGQNAWEEVDVAPADTSGLDFGWHRWEGDHCYEPQTGCDPTGVTPPVTEYSHAKGCAVTGGMVYRGSAIPALRGAYLYGDYCSGTIWALDAAAGLGAHDRGPLEATTLIESKRSISSFGVDEAGEAYVTDLAGSLLRVVPAR